MFQAQEKPSQHLAIGEHGAARRIDGQQVKVGPDAVALRVLVCKEPAPAAGNTRGSSDAVTPSCAMQACNVHTARASGE